MNWIKEIIEKISCKHQWRVVHIVRYRDASDRILMTCEKCGRIVKRRV